MTCHHVFQRSRPRRVMTDHTGCYWYVTLLRCRRCGYTDVEYHMVDPRPVKPKPVPKRKRKNPRRIPPQEQKRLVLRRRMRELGL
jgi:hypothetical protein